MSWRIYAASATGTSHLDKGIACQDAFAYRAQGDALVAVVCDGAGSAARSDEGARLIADTAVQALADAGPGLPALAEAEEATVRAAVEAAVAAARARVEQAAQAAGAELSSFAATLVGYLGDAGGGWFFHIGDGIGVAEADEDGAAAAISAPENGEYANETYFVTGSAWRERLRLQAAPWPAQRLALMSDGAMPFAMAKGNAGLYRPFIEPVCRYLRSVEPGPGSQALHGTLADPRTHGITSDDKTLLIALRG